MADKKVIEGTDVTASQLKELFSAISLGRITRQSMQGFLENPGKFSATQNSVATFLTADYFTTRSGFQVSRDFSAWITSAYLERLVPRGLDGVESFDLVSNSFGQDILGQMGGEENVRKHAFTPDQVAALIDLQPEGLEGKLLTDGISNLFYMVGADGVLFIVAVDWCADDPDGEQGVFAFRIDEGDDDVEWCEGSRVFYNTRTF